MNTITDDLLNKFMDNDLNDEEIAIVNKALAENEDIKYRYESLLKVHNMIKEIGADTPGSGFNEILMQKILKRKRIISQQKLLLFSMLSVFGIIILSIVGYVFYETVSSIEINSGNSILTSYTKSFVEYFYVLVPKKYVFLFTSVLLFVVITGVYLLFDYQKRGYKNTATG